MDLILLISEHLRKECLYFPSLGLESKKGEVRLAVRCQLEGGCTGPMKEKEERLLGVLEVTLTAVCDSWAVGVLVWNLQVNAGAAG